jgi:AraC-like DNA-binding protein
VIAWAAASAPSIPAHQLPALALAFARGRDVPDAVLLKGLDGEPSGLVPAAGCLRLLSNALRALGTADGPFMLGQQLLPGHDGAASNALVQAPDLRTALAILSRWHARLTPLLRPRVETWDGVAALYWVDSQGAPGLLPALVEMHMTAVVALCRWLGGERLPWRFCFNRAAPRHVEQHHVHLGSELRFGCRFDAMLIDAAWLDRPWPRGSALAADLAQRAAVAEPERPAGLLAALYDYLLERVRVAPSLEQAAGDFGVSPATFKRQLARHGTHFQAELDQVRTHVALWMFQAQGADNEAVARHLGFHDAANFRRSFKRWTGLTPLLLREALGAA